MRLFAFVLVGLLLAPASAALGQGTSNTLPDPIAGTDLSAYARRLGMSSQQRLAIDRPHETYLAAFTELREREIEKFLSESGSVIRRFWSAPNSREVRSALRDYDRLRGRIKALDAQLFDEIQSLLSDDQVELMPLVRQHRERVRLRTGLARMVTSANAAARVDLSELLAGVDVAPPDRATVEPIVSDYERQLTAATRKLSSEAGRMIVEVVEQMEERLAGNPNAQRQRWTAFAEIWREEGKGLTVAASDVGDLNWRSLRSIGGLLPIEPAVDLRRVYLKRAYSGLKVTRTEALDQYDDALDRGLGETLRDEVIAARNSFRSRHDRVVDEMVDITRKQHREGTIRGFGGGRRASPEITEKLEALRARRTAILAEAATVLIALLGEERVAALAATSRPSDDEADEDAGGGGPATGVTRTPTAPHLLGTKSPPDPGERYTGPDPYLPAPITTDELTWFAALASMDDGDVAVLESLHDGYLERWEELGGATANVLEAVRAIAPRSGRREGPTVAEEDVDRVYDLRRRTLSSMRTLDEVFLADVEIAILGGDADRLQRLRHARNRIVYRHGSVPPQAGRRRTARRSRGDREAAIDLVLLVGHGLLDKQGRAEAAGALTDYERDLAETLQNRYEQRVERARNDDRMRVEFFAQGRRSSRQRNAYNKAMNKASAPLIKRLDALDKRIADLNRAGVETLTTALPPSDAERVRVRYRALLHPEVYDDPRAVEPAFRAALAVEPAFRAALDLPDLSGEQRVIVGEVFAEYRGAYGHVCTSMADVLDADEGEVNDANRWQRWADRRNRFEKLRFDREELNDKTLRRLRAALTEQQQQRLGFGTDA